MEPIDPLPTFLARQAALVIDGGLATDLEARGQDLNHPLWSARILAEQPEAIREVHLAYARAGADVLITASYQASIPGFEAAGYSAEKARHCLVDAVRLAQVSEEVGRRVLVAASVGPYGAFLADGSEYRGRYGLSVGELREWHRPRLEILQGTGADLLAIETIPSLEEVQALAELLDDYGHVRAWMSLCCPDAGHLHDGTSLDRVLDVVGNHPQIVAVGVNCVSPAIVEEAVRNLRSLTGKPILAYPNSGECYDNASKSWTGIADPDAFADAAVKWRDAGCSLIGGCCRTTPAHIAKLHERLT